MFGEDTDADNEVEQYFTANMVTTWNNVLNVRIGLLARTPDQVNSSADTKTYNLAGTQVDDTSTSAKHDADRRIRYAFNSTVKIRNRGIY
jgi:type IV pilus assembly protein PilW